MPTIELIENERVVRRFALGDCPFIVGREDGCDLVLEDEWISRRHLALRPLGAGEWEAVDLGSGNGSFIGSERIQSTVLSHGDMLRLGSSVLRFRHERGREPREDSPSKAAVDPHLARQLAQARVENESLKAELSVYRATQGRGQESPSSKQPLPHSHVLHPRLRMHFHRPHGKAGPAIGRAPKEKGVLLRWVFLGVGRIGDSLCQSLLHLGRTRLRVVLETMVPAHRIQSPAKIVLRPEESVPPLPLVDDLAAGIEAVDTWLKDENTGATDIFVMLAADLFGGGSQALSRLRDFMNVVGASLSGTVRPHVILVQDQTDEAVDAMPWRALIDSGLLKSVICVDCQRVTGFGPARQKTPMMTVAGTLDSAQRLTLRQPVLGIWQEEDLARFLEQDGFSTFGCSATDRVEDLDQAIEDLRQQALFHGGFAHGLARRVFVLAVVGMAMHDSLSDLLAAVQGGLESVHDQWPQAQASWAIYTDSADSVRLFIGVAGQAKCQFSQIPRS